MTSVNIGLRNLYGEVLWGNSLTLEVKKVYRTGFNLHGGVIREIPVETGPAPAIPTDTKNPSIQPARDDDERPSVQRELF